MHAHELFRVGTNLRLDDLHIGKAPSAAQPVHHVGTRLEMCVANVQKAAGTIFYEAIAFWG
ncbi:hypothetical protein GCM10008941_01700 [Rhizomicrobium palustre]